MLKLICFKLIPTVCFFAAALACGVLGLPLPFCASMALFAAAVFA